MLAYFLFFQFMHYLSVWSTAKSGHFHVLFSLLKVKTLALYCDMQLLDRFVVVSDPFCSLFNGFFRRNEIIKAVYVREITVRMGLMHLKEGGMKLNLSPVGVSLTPPSLLRRVRTRTHALSLFLFTPERMTSPLCLGFLYDPGVSHFPRQTSASSTSERISLCTHRYSICLQPPHIQRAQHIFQWRPPQQERRLHRQLQLAQRRIYSS